jgi:hypothetical protein
MPLDTSSGKYSLFSKVINPVVVLSQKIYGSRPANPISTFRRELASFLSLLAVLFGRSPCYPESIIFTSSNTIRNKSPPECCYRVRLFADLREGLEEHTYHVEDTTEAMQAMIAHEIEGVDLRHSEDGIEVVTYGGEVEALD